jgi:hypothetical protein
VATVFAVCAGLGLGAALLVAGLRTATSTPSSGRPAPVLAGLAEGLWLTASRPRVRLMLGLLTAHSAATVYQLNREPFLSAVLGHAQTFREASRIAGARLAADVAREHPQGPRLPLPSSPAGQMP